MSEHVVTLNWQLQTDSFEYDNYNRTHSIIFSDENKLCASAAPEYHGDPSCVNPEQAFVASLASCHMLTFLALASKKRYVVTAYIDTALGILGKNSAGKTAISQIDLSPTVTFTSEHIPTEEIFNQLQERAHKGCFIANSIASCIKVNIDATMKIDH